MVHDPNSEVVRLENRAAALIPHLRNARRAFVIEFAGTPKSGKTTAVEAIRHFFSRNGFRVYVLAERAALCPIPMKGHLFFNTWCAASMLAELLENIEADADIVIVDRGIFDALVWLNLQRRRGEVAEEEAARIEQFLLLARWRKLIDLPVVLHVSAQKALERETSQRITSKPGSIMNPDVLSSIASSVEEVAERNRDSFPNLVLIDTTSRGLRESNVFLADAILDHLDEFLNPEILVVPRDKVETLPWRDGGAFTEEARTEALACIQQHGLRMKRGDAEKRGDLVQVVTCGVLTDDERVFVFRRKEEDPKSRMYGRTVLWHGTHVEHQTEEDIERLLIYALRDRLMRSLFLGPTLPVQLAGYCWDRDDPDSSRHFGVLFGVRVENPHTAEDLKKKEFRHGRGHDLAGQFATWTEVVESAEGMDLESWSKAILKNLDEFRNSVWRT